MKMVASPQILVVAVAILLAAPRSALGLYHDMSETLQYFTNTARLRPQLMRVREIELSRNVKLMVSTLTNFSSVGEKFYFLVIACLHVTMTPCSQKALLLSCSIGKQTTKCDTCVW